VARHLILVARGEPDLYDYLLRRLAGVGKVAVIADRRRGERRQRVEARAPERRRGERRRRPEVDRALRYQPVVIVRLEE
jgi:hypothetical protein